MLPVLDSVHDHVPEGLRERKKREARVAIADAALELFARHGYDDTTVAQVAARAGVSPATVARYYPTKESLLFPERDLNVAAVQEAIAGRPATESPFAAVVGALSAATPVDPEVRRRLRLSRQAISRSAALRGRAQTLLDAWRDALCEAALARGADPGAARVLATVVVAVLDEVADRWAHADGDHELAPLVADAFDALERSHRRTP